MIFKEFGNKNNKAIIFLHGGGLSWWTWKTQIDMLQNDYFVVAPIIDGHGEDGHNSFATIQNSAQNVINYIKENCNGKVFAICGLSLGAQMLVEILSKECDITENVIIESALVCPSSKISIKLTTLILSLSYGLIKKRWFAKLQAKQLKLPQTLFENYYEDTIKITKETLINFIKSNQEYSIPDTLRNTKSKTLILVGEKELPVMKKSAKLLNDTINGSNLKIIKNSAHGEISLSYPDKYLDLLINFFKNNCC
ncbi:alpha/beta fold hydrolase [Clostridium hydrogenum]|uniref:alpha/beta fold hydrolase n=1 Tax=Clostridium hydrogenum TaxID=2855764 RepID=UPI001F1798FE|nr:alpha/beta hydrolase [Clostridium hydrogenum]